MFFLRLLILISTSIIKYHKLNTIPIVSFPEDPCRPRKIEIKIIVRLLFTNVKLEHEEEKKINSD